jgi:16S rRNA (guanine(966)-N(2))-methyltransferase RsmD
LRVIAGDARGKRLFSPADRSIRPTSDKVKGAIFSMICAHIPDAVVVDMFCGTGGLGVEALSRGARYCYFCDNSAKARALTEKNIEHCDMKDRAEMLCCDYRTALGRISAPADVIFMDPPYECDYCADCMTALASAGLMGKDGVVVCEHSARHSFSDLIPKFVRIKEKRYGIAGVTVFSYEG